MPIRKKLFHLTESEVNQVLFCDNSDDQEGLTLDDEDLGLLEKDLEFIEKNGEMDYVVEINIEPPQSGTSIAIDDTVVSSLLLLGNFFNCRDFVSLLYSIIPR